MTGDIERQFGSGDNSFIKERPTDPEIPPELEKGGHVTQVSSQFKAQVADDMGRNLIQTPQTQSVTIQIPATQSQLEDWSKGNPENALTWFAVFWIRLIKKGLYFGWRMIKKITGRSEDV